MGPCGAGFRRHASYRGAIIGGALTNSVFGVLRASILSATIVTAGGELGGYAVAAGVTYAWVTQALIGPVQIFTWDDLALRVRTGDIAVDLARPWTFRCSTPPRTSGGPPPSRYRGGCRRWRSAR